MKNILKNSTPIEHDQTHYALMGRSSSYYDNLARISATLLAALIALLTFLLVVGAQNQVKGFSGLLYITMSILGTSLVLYVVGYVVDGAHQATLKRITGKKENSKVRKTEHLLAKSSIVMSGLQQIVFIASIAAVVWFAISYTQLILNPKPVQQSPTSQQSQSGSGSTTPSSGETAEQHATETPQQP